MTHELLEQLAALRAAQGELMDDLVWNPAADALASAALAEPGRRAA